MLQRLIEGARRHAHALTGGAPKDRDIAALCARIDATASARRHDLAPDPALDEALLAQLFDQGLFSLTVPVAHGGFAATLHDFVWAMESVGRLGPAYAMTAVPHLCISVKAVATLHEPAKAGEILEAIRAQRRLLAFAITEDHGSDVASVSTRLQCRADGSWVLDGRKQWITNLKRASHVVVVALCPDLHPAPSATALVCVALTQPGVTVGSPWVKHCAKGSDTADLYFDAVEIDPSQVLGTPGKGMSLFNDMVQPGRLGAAAAIVGMAWESLEAASADPDSPLPPAHRARLHATLDALRRTLLVTASLGDAHDPIFPALVSLTKHICSLEAQQVVSAIDHAYACQGRPTPPVATRAAQSVGLLRLLKGPGEVIALQTVASWLRQTDAAAPNPAWPRAVRYAYRLLARGFEALVTQGGPSANPAAAVALSEATAAAWMLAASLPAPACGFGSPAARWAWRRFRAYAAQLAASSAPAAADQIASFHAALVQARQNGHLGPSRLGDTTWQ